MRTSFKLAAAALLVPMIGACSTIGSETSFNSPYYLVKANKETRVGNRSMAVTAPEAWNRVRPRLFDDVPEVEDWTLNGPNLDTVSYVTGLKNSKAIVRQRQTDERKVPIFRSDMTAPEIAAMLETLFRNRLGAAEFKTLGLQPRTFLGVPGFQFDYEHLDNDELWRKGRTVGAVYGDRLYLVVYDAARSHYYNAELADVEAIINSARLVR